MADHAVSSTSSDDVDPNILIETDSGYVSKVVTLPADAAPADKTPSPKVVAGSVAGLGVLVVVAALTAVTPDLLAPLGPWASVVGAALAAFAAGLASFLKADPRRV